MKNISMSVLIILLTSLFLAGCDSKNDFKNTETIELVSNPTTGYEWHYYFDKNDIVQEISSKYISNHDKFYGSSGKRIWKFKGVNPGTVKIKFEYKRLCENNDPVKTIEFIFKVNKQNKIKLIKQTSTI